jgi:putative phage-type endonuclease
MRTYPDAVVLMTADEVAADRDRWLRMRREGIGGSDASKVVGLNEWASPYQLWMDKLGIAPPVTVTNAMEWGHRLEPAIRQWFTDTTGIPVALEGLLAHKLHSWQLFSPDGITADHGILEIKTTHGWSLDAEKWLDGEIPDHAELQIQHGLAVTGLTHAHAVALIDGRDPVHLTAARDQQLIDTLTEVEGAFWADRVLAEVPPPIDGLPATSEAIKRRYARAERRTATAGQELLDLYDQRDAAKARAKAAELEADEYENKIRALFGHADTIMVHGEEVATLRANGTFAPTRLAEDHPDLYAEYLVDRPCFDAHAFRDDNPHIYAQYCARVLRRAPKKGTSRRG